MKSVLILTELFPPVPGIGGRRWAKFAKYFTKLNIKVNVVCAPFDASIHDVSLWYDDVIDNPLIEVHTMPLNYPEVLNTVPKTIIEKVNYKSAEAKLKLLTKGSIFDRTLNWGSDYVELVDRIIASQRIDTVFATIAPLNLAFQVVQLKSKYPNVSFVADFRDPWTLSRSYGFPQSNHSRQSEEVRKESVVCNRFDWIMAPNDNILKDLSAMYGIRKSKLYKLPHAIDCDDYINLHPVKKNTEKKSAKKIAIVGTMYDNLQQEFDDLFSATKNRTDVEFHFFLSNRKDEYLQNARPETLHFHEPIKPKQLFAELSGYDYLFIVYNKMMLNLLYTKVVEFICVNVPIVIVGQTGEASDFILQNSLGALIENDHILEGVSELLDKGISYNNSFDCNAFKFETVTEHLIDTITSNRNVATTLHLTKQKADAIDAEQ